MSDDTEEQKKQAEEAKDEVKEHVLGQVDEFKKSRIRDFLFFDILHTEKIITLVYWLLIIGSIFAGISALFSGDPLRGLGIVIFGIVLSRIACEMMIVLFKMNEALQDMRPNKAKPRAKTKPKAKPKSKAEEKKE